MLPNSEESIGKDNGKTSKMDTKGSISMFFDVLNELMYKKKFQFPEEGTIIYTSLENAIISIIIENNFQQTGITIDKLKEYSFGTWYINLKREFIQITDIIFEIELAKNSFGKFSSLKRNKNMITTTVRHIPDHFSFKFDPLYHISLENRIQKFIKENSELFPLYFTEFASKMYENEVNIGIQTHLRPCGDWRVLFRHIIQYSIGSTYKDMMISLTKPKIPIVSEDKEFQNLYEILLKYNNNGPIYHADLMNLAHKYDLYLEISDENEFLDMFLSQSNTYRLFEYVGFKTMTDISFTKKFHIYYPSFDQRLIKYLSENYLHYYRESVINKFGKEIENNPLLYLDDNDQFYTLQDVIYVNYYGNLYIHQLYNAITTEMVKHNNYSITDEILDACGDYEIPVTYNRINAVKFVDKNIVYGFLVGNGEDSPLLHQMATKKATDPYPAPKRKRGRPPVKKYKDESDEDIPSIEEENETKKEEKSKPEKHEKSQEKPAKGRVKKSKKKKGRKEQAADIEEETNPQPKPEPKKRTIHKKKDEDYKESELEEDNSPRPSYIMPKYLPINSESSSETSEYDLEEYQQPEFIRDPDPKVGFTAQKQGRKYVEIDINAPKFNYIPARPIPPIEEELGRMKNNSNFSIDWAIKNLYPKYCGTMETEAFIKYIIHCLGKIEAVL